MSKTRQVNSKPAKLNIPLEKPILLVKKDKSTVEWKHVNWRKLEKRVYKLQKRIYRASKRGDVKAIRRLQKTLMKSWSAKMISVRRVSQDNQGKKTAGVDGIKMLTPKQRFALVAKLKLGSKCRPTKRVWIPKPGKDEKRPLGIPTMYDRALQALTKKALEPEWEARFEKEAWGGGGGTPPPPTLRPNSYGFRPGRSCHDAIGAIFDAIKQKAKFVLDADISQCFDRIDQKALLTKLNTFPTIRRQVRAWFPIWRQKNDGSLHNRSPMLLTDKLKTRLPSFFQALPRLKAGVMDKGQFQETSFGTPQGGVISPLLARRFRGKLPPKSSLANIALHGMEGRIKQVAETLKGCKRTNRNSLSLIRYADDFVIIHEDITVVTRCKQVIAEWLKGMGLELKSSKTVLAHTLLEYEYKPGFEFLGFNIRQFPTGKYTSGKIKDKLLGFKTIITPSPKKTKAHYEKIVRIINTHKAMPQVALIRNLNPIIKGWANYYSTVVSKETYSQLDSLVYKKLKSWAKSRHPNKSRKWIDSKYWGTDEGSSTFATPHKSKNSVRLIKHDSTAIVRHVKVKGNSSPFDGNLIYWSTRMGTHPEATIRMTILLKKQKGKCNHCGLYFREEDVLEIDHITPRNQGGKDEYKNLQILHRHCHDTKTANDVLAYGTQVKR